MNNPKEPQIIGGMFGLHLFPDESASAPPFLSESNICLNNARSGIWLLTKQLKPKQVWCPSYLCHTILHAVTEANTPIRFYEVDDNLQIASHEWINDIQPGDLVIFINYFGFINDLEFVKEAKGKKAWVLADSSQALLTKHESKNYDFILYSPIKFIGIPNGGILNPRRNFQFEGIELNPPSEDWRMKGLTASILRREFDLFGGERLWFQLFRDTGINSPIGPYKMSDLSNILLRKNFDYQSIANQRRENYQTLVNEFAEYAIFPELSEDVVPLGFPIRMKNRDGVREALFSHQIYPPVHWPMHRMVPKIFEKSYTLSNEIMTLPCDQRYNKNTITRMVNAVRKVSKC
jgi:dTDP-4-amino-4,6-dideoxygalactose transaminase